MAAFCLEGQESGRGLSGARRPVRMCVRCPTVTHTPVTVAEVHQATGPGFNVYASPECALHYPPLPYVREGGSGR